MVKKYSLYCTGLFKYRNYEFELRDYNNNVIVSTNELKYNFGDAVLFTFLTDSMYKNQMELSKDLFRNYNPGLEELD